MEKEDNTQKILEAISGRLSNTQFLFSFKRLKISNPLYLNRIWHNPGGEEGHGCLHLTHLTINGI